MLSTSTVDIHIGRIADHDHVSTSRTGAIDGTFNVDSDALAVLECDPCTESLIALGHEYLAASLSGCTC